MLCFGAILGLFLKGGRSVRKYLRDPKAGKKKRELAHLAFFFWLGCLAFLIHGLVGHDFFRPWYQALFFSHLGILQGAAMALENHGE